MSKMQALMIGRPECGLVFMLNTYVRMLGLMLAEMRHKMQTLLMVRRE